MRRCGAWVFVVALLLSWAGAACAQSSRTRPLPVTTVAQRKDAPNPPADPLKQVILAIELNQRRMLSPSRGNYTGDPPWAIMHGLLALREDYVLRVGNQPMNAIDYITKTNPTHTEMTWRAPEYWFEATAYGGRPHPYNQMFAFEGHVNQFLAIMSMANLPLTHEFKVRDPQRPGATKTITMADMVHHAKMHVNAHEEVSWTIWFLSNYIEPDAEWVNKDGQKWSMEQLVTIQVNAPLFNANGPVAPCGGTHGLFALACACNSYQQKHGQLRGAWIAARQKLDNHISYARGGQNRDASFSTKFFQANEYSDQMGPRFKASGHMLEWLMMALPPERLQEQWIQAATMSVANDLVSHSNKDLSVPDTGAMYHALHALVLYRNRVQPPTAAPVAPPMVAQLPSEQQNPAPVTKAAPIAPAPLLPGMTPKLIPGNVGPVPAPNSNAAPQPNANTPNKANPEGRIRLLPPPKTMAPNRRNRLLLRPITDKNPDGTPVADSPTDEESATTPPMPGGQPQPVEPGKLPLLIPTVPALEKPALKSLTPMPIPSEPKSEGAAVAKPPAAEEGADAPVPLFNDAPEPVIPAPAKVPEKQPAKAPKPVEGTPAKPPTDDPKPSTDQKPPAPLLVPSLAEPSNETPPSTAEPTTPKAPSSSD